MDLEEWNPKQRVKLPARFLLLAKTNCGKSVFLKWLIKELEDQISYVLVFCPTSFNGFWGQITDEVHDTWKPEYVESIIEARKKAIIAGKKPKNILIVLDDCLESGTIDLSRDHLLNKLMAQGRHTFCSVALISQKLTKLSTIIRSNAEYIIFLSWSNMREFEAYHEEFGNMDKESFKRMFQEFCHSYQAIIHDNTGYSVRWWVEKADMIDDHPFTKFHKRAAFEEKKRKQQEEQATKPPPVKDSTTVCKTLSKFERELEGIPKLSQISPKKKKMLIKCKKR